MYTYSYPLHYFGVVFLIKLNMLIKKLKHQIVLLTNHLSNINLIA